jgi:hypothetical protein
MRYKRQGFSGYNSTYTPANGERDYVHNYYPPEMHHSGLDEGYYYDDCPHCGRRTEHDDGACIPCSN